MATLLRLMPATMNWTTASESALQPECRCEVCPLSQVKAGVAVRIRRLCAAPELQNRLRELGLGEDQIIKLLTGQTNFIWRNSSWSNRSAPQSFRSLSHSSDGIGRFPSGQALFGRHKAAHHLLQRC